MIPRIARRQSGFFLRNRWKLLLALFAVVLLSPMGQEWATFIAKRGSAADFPKGWPLKTQWHDWGKPEDPEELSAYEYAHALELPDRLPKPVPFYFILHWYQNREDTAESYFRHLCQTESGEYVFKIVDKVEGIYQMRMFPQYEYRKSVPLEKIQNVSVYEIEDYADWSVDENSGNLAIFLGNKKYRYVESRRNPKEIDEGNRIDWTIVPWNPPGLDYVEEEIASGSEGKPPSLPGKSPPAGPIYWRYHRFGGVGEASPVKQLEARHAYTWRGIRRERDREYGIFGGELIVLDRLTGEILGVRRSFIKATWHKAARTMKGYPLEMCPLATDPDTKEPVERKTAYPFGFISKVLIPIDSD
jgi:hypothetical protein